MSLTGSKSVIVGASKSFVAPAAIVASLETAAPATEMPKAGSVPATSFSPSPSTHFENVNKNRGHIDVIDEGTPIPPGPKRHRLNPNLSPGIPLDNKDSICGRLIHYVTGGSHPTNMSGTHVPGIRMDGATEGEYPKGLFAYNPRAVKAFVNCFAGYFNTMGGNIPPCPGDCPPKSLNLNENSNRSNPLKKSAYEYPWSIRAGFLPETIEAFELMEDAVAKTKSKPTKEKKPSPAAETTETTTAARTKRTDATNSTAMTAGASTNAAVASVGKEKGASTSGPSMAAVRSSAANDNDNSNASSGGRGAASGRNLSKAPSTVGDSKESSTTPKKSLWRELQRQRALQHDEERKRLELEWEQQLREESDDHYRREKQCRDNSNNALKLVDKYRDEIEAKISRTRITTMGGASDLPSIQRALHLRPRDSDASCRTGVSDLPSIQDELRLRRNYSNATCRSVDSALDRKFHAASQQSFERAIGPSILCQTEWVPSAASGML